MVKYTLAYLISRAPLLRFAPTSPYSSSCTTSSSSTRFQVGLLGSSTSERRYLLILCRCSPSCARTLLSVARYCGAPPRAPTVPTVLYQPVTLIHRVRGSVCHCGDDPIWYFTTCNLVTYAYGLFVSHATSWCRVGFLMLGQLSPGDQLSESLTIVEIRHVLDKLQLALGTCPLSLCSFSRHLPR